MRRNTYYFRGIDKCLLKKMGAKSRRNEFLKYTAEALDVMKDVLCVIGALLLVLALCSADSTGDAYRIFVVYQSAVGMAILAVAFLLFRVREALLQKVHQNLRALHLFRDIYVGGER